MNEELELLDIITILSFVIAIQNFEFGQKQGTIQQDMLATIIRQNEEILNILKEKRK